VAWKGLSGNRERERERERAGSYGGLQIFLAGVHLSIWNLWYTCHGSWLTAAPEVGADSRDRTNMFNVQISWSIQYCICRYDLSPVYHYGKPEKNETKIRSS
jgi:hypothetical protein